LERRRSEVPAELMPPETIQASLFGKLFCFRPLYLPMHNVLEAFYAMNSHLLMQGPC
jgi:hypothetical protein